MATVRQILEGKGRELWQVNPNTLVIEALKLMADKNIGAVLVTRDASVVGIFSERDYARKVVLRGKTSLITVVEDVMTPDVITVSPGQSTDECMALMTRKHIRHLPVLENGVLAGMISIGDVVKAILAEHEQTIQHLTNYISGSRG